MDREKTPDAFVSAIIFEGGSDMKGLKLRAYMFLVVIAVAMFQSFPVYADRASVDFGPFACLPGKNPIVVKEDDYINLMLINVLNAPEKPWFVKGESTISTKVLFRPSAGTEWNYVRTVDKIGDSFEGLDQNLALGPRRMPLPRVIGGFQPLLTVSMVETEREKAYKPLLDGLSKVASTVPNPATAVASVVINTVSDVYSNVFTAWMASNGLRIEANLGFSFDPSQTKNCDNLGSSTPLLGNVAYIILGTTEFGGHVINKTWARENLKLDDDGSLLLFRKDVTFTKNWSDLKKKAGDRFELTSYMLLKFDTSKSEIQKGAEVYNNEEMRQQFEEARQAGDTSLRKAKRKTLANNLQKSTILSYKDTLLLLDAFNKYTTGQDEDWDIFWINWANKLKREDILQVHQTLPQDMRGLSSDALEVTTSSLLGDADTMTKFQATVAELGFKERIEVQKALAQAGHDPGSITGMDDDRTRTALKSFQSATGLVSTGARNIDTLKALKVPLKLDR